MIKSLVLYEISLFTKQCLRPRIELGGEGAADVMPYAEDGAGDGGQGVGGKMEHG